MRRGGRSVQRPGQRSSQDGQTSGDVSHLGATMLVRTYVLSWLRGFAPPRSPTASRGTSSCEVSRLLRPTAPAKLASAPVQRRSRPSAASPPVHMRRVRADTTCGKRHAKSVMRTGRARLTRSQTEHATRTAETRHTESQSTRASTSRPTYVRTLATATHTYAPAVSHERGPPWQSPCPEQ